MNQECESYTRCAKHPSQFFTGFCSSCLVERLCNVGAAEQSLEEPCSSQTEIVEVHESEKNPTEVGVRRTLQLLFQLDDNDNVGCKEHTPKNEVGPVNSSVDDCGVTVASDFNISKAVDFEVSHDRPMGDSESNVVATNDDGKHINHLEDEKLNDGGASFRLSSMLSRKGWRWRTRSMSRKDDIQDDRKSSRGQEDQQYESTPNLRHSCDWRVCRDLSKGSLDPPRHSWDGSMVTKAFACSFACLEERKVDPRKMGNTLPDETVMGKSNQITDDTGGAKFNHDDEKNSSSDCSLGSLFRERSHEEFHQETNLSKIRRKSQRWGKVWDWSITSPFRDFAKKRERTLERSLSESWREGRNIKNTDNYGSECSLQSRGTSLTSARANQHKNRSLNAANGDIVNLRTDWQKKRDLNISRSRSVHYSSPGNLDNGLLRFYLTPLRSSRRCTSKGRAKHSRSLARGIFGFY